MKVTIKGQHEGDLCIEGIELNLDYIEVYMTNMYDKWYKILNIHCTNINFLI